MKTCTQSKGVPFISVEQLRREGRLPTRAGRATVRFASTLTRLRGNTVYFIPRGEISVIHRGRIIVQRSLLGRAYFAGDDGTTVFCSSIPLRSATILKRKGEEAFFKSLESPAFAELERLLGPGIWAGPLDRQGDIQFRPVACGWGELETLLTDRRRSVWLLPYRKTINKRSLFGTGHRLTGQISLEGTVVPSHRTTRYGLYPYYFATGTIIHQSRRTRKEEHPPAHLKGLCLVSPADTCLDD